MSNRESPEKSVDLEEAKPGVKPRAIARREHRQRNDTRIGKPADGPCLQLGVEGLKSHQLIENQPEYKVRDHWPQTQLGQSEEQFTLRRPLVPTKTSLTRRLAGQAGRDQHVQDREELKKTISGPISIEPPQSAITPAFDAPISAVNAGERRVTVRYGQYSMSLPVMPSTTPLDILSLAAHQSQVTISSTMMIVVESYQQLGLERPLRKYEHVRDIMNSWDNDMQNTLLIVPSPTGGRDEDLGLDSVQKVLPVDTSVSIYHSQRPGHWDKQWVTLRSDGQVLVSKKQGGQASNICHLSDFDIYIPTARQLSKRIKPPRKLCFTVKSQQKSSMFMSTENFVHFFSTSDKCLATSWYKAVQGWRSWYLVNVMGEGQKDLPSPKKEIAVSGPRGSIDNGARMKYAGWPPIQSEDQKTVSAPDSLPQPMPIHHRGAPPSSFLKKLTKDADLGAPTTYTDDPPVILRRNTEPNPFSADSLLGRTYTQRQKAQQSKEKDRTASVPAIQHATVQPSGLKRIPLQRQKPGPLVDLTPQYREPPQHTRKGRAVVPAQMPAGGLIEIATSPEVAVEIPPATTWQRPTTSSTDNEHGFDPNLQRSRMKSGDHSNSSSLVPRQPSTSPGKGKDPFTTGLLAGNRRGQGGMRTG